MFDGWSRGQRQLPAKSLGLSRFAWDKLGLNLVRPRLQILSNTRY